MTATTLRPGPERSPSTALGGSDHHRPEIQGLRALAVALVVVFHLWPTRVSGGFIGVDVFFVISGYLITAHLLREVEATGRLRVVRFWARRVRRLLPASLFVLAVSAVAVVAVVPPSVWAQSVRQIIASTLYVQNWALALDAVDYMAADNVPTVAQHYWSLSLEEQFYLVWPVLIACVVAGLGLWRRRQAHHRGADEQGPDVRRWLTAGVAAVCVLSLAWSAFSTAQDQAFAYFSTLTRVWELGAGALGALVVLHRPLQPRLAAVLGWSGLVAVVVAAAWFDGHTLFPGVAALVPVVGTLAVIAAGRGAGLTSPGAWLSHPVCRFVGDISFSIYLWHWPLIVLAPQVTGHALTLPESLVVVALTVLLAWLTKVFVEDPSRRHPGWAVPWMTFAVAGTVMLVVVLGCLGISSELESRRGAAEAAATERLALDAKCTGPGALVPANDCGPVVGNGEFLVPPEVVALQNTDAAFPDCQQEADADGVVTCEIGATTRPERVVALVGDSHATHWFPAFDKLGAERGWKVVTMTKSGCPFTDARRVVETEQTDARQKSCEAWVDDVRADLLADEGITDVFVSSFASDYGWEHRPDHDTEGDARTGGFVTAWDDLTGAGKRVLVLADVPRTQGDNVPNCLLENPTDLEACSVEREKALADDPTVEAAPQADDQGVHVIDLSDEFCDDELCYPVVGDVIVYRDFSHLSTEYATLLVPALSARLDDLD